MADETPQTPAPVPYERYKETTEKITSLKAELRGARAEAETYKTKIGEYEPKVKELEGASATIEKLKAEHKAAADGWAEERGLLVHGVTDEEDVVVARTLYARLPAEGKPKSIGDWLGSLKAEGATPPKALSHLFTKPAPGDPKAAPPPRPNPGGGGAPPSNGSKPNAAQLREATEQFRDGKIDAVTLQGILAASRRPG
jgi:hypothetical protein